ncbi:hypothetical protein APR11_004654 [Nocardia amikacinitolerans]|nr:hypothetical protein [Nocardia amikacinitolerans]
MTVGISVDDWLENGRGTSEQRCEVASLAGWASGSRECSRAGGSLTRSWLGAEKPVHPVTPRVRR